MKKTAEQVLNKYSISYGKISFPAPRAIVRASEALEAMHEFASQSRPEITDEELEDKFPISFDNIQNKLNIKSFSQGVADMIKSISERNNQYQFVAKWYRAELRKRNIPDNRDKVIEKQEELIEQYKMYYDSVHAPQIITIIPEVWKNHTANLESELSALQSVTTKDSTDIDEVREKRNIKDLPHSYITSAGKDQT